MNLFISQSTNRNTTIQPLKNFWIKQCVCLINLFSRELGCWEIFYVVFLLETPIDISSKLNSNRAPQENLMQMKKKLSPFETYTFHFLLRRTFLSWKIGWYSRIVCDISYDNIFYSHPWLSGFRNMNLCDYV